MKLMKKKELNLEKSKLQSSKTIKKLSKIDGAKSPLNLQV